MPDCQAEEILLIDTFESFWDYSANEGKHGQSSCRLAAGGNSAPIRLCVPHNPMPRAACHD